MSLQISKFDYFMNESPYSNAFYNKIMNIKMKIMQKRPQGEKCRLNKITYEHNGR